MLEVFKSPIYRILWLSVLFNVTSNNIGYLALYEIMNHIYSKVIAVSYYYGLYSVIPFILTYIVAVIIDRYDQRWIRLLASMTDTAVEIGFIFAYKYELVWLFYVCGGIISACYAFSQPALSAYTAKVIDKDLLIHANTIDMMTYTIGGIIMKAIGGVLLLKFNVLDLYIFVLCLFFVTDVFLSCHIWYPTFDKIYKESSGKKNADKNKGKSQIQMFKEGWTYLKKNPSIFHIVLIKTFCNLAIGFSISAGYYYGFDKFTVLDNGAFTMAIAGIATAILSTITSYIANKFVGNNIKKMVSMMVLAMFFMVLAMGGYIFAINIYIWIASQALLYTGNILIFSMLKTIIQKQVPDEVQGRVNSIGYIFRKITWGSAIMIGGYVMTYYPDYMFWCFVGFGISQALTFFYSIYVRMTFKIDYNIRNEERPLVSGDFPPPIISTYKSTKPVKIKKKSRPKDTISYQNISINGEDNFVLSDDPIDDIYQESV